MKLSNPYEGRGPAWEAKRRAWEEGAEAVRLAVTAVMNQAQEVAGDELWTPGMVKMFFKRVREAWE